VDAYLHLTGVTSVARNTLTGPIILKSSTIGAIYDSIAMVPTEIIAVTVTNLIGTVDMAVFAIFSLTRYTRIVWGTLALSIAQSSAVHTGNDGFTPLASCITQAFATATEPKAAVKTLSHFTYSTAKMIGADACGVGQPSCPI